MDPEYFALYAAIACAVSVAACGCCGNGIDPTAIIDVLAGCKSICWDPARWFGWNRGGWWNFGWACGWGSASWKLPSWCWWTSEVVAEPAIWIGFLDPLVIVGKYVPLVILGSFLIYASNFLLKMLHESGEP